MSMLCADCIALSSTSTALRAFAHQAKRSSGKTRMRLAILAFAVTLVTA